jgi:N-methylhydantoinase A
MGGTTAKSCLVTGGEPAITTDFETARVHRFKKGSGFPVRLPVVDMMEIGAGGGSIARIDETGLLKVGPDSAGASPGPACYGRGGEQPTVTDAALLLGYLDAEGSLSGQVTLRPDLAQTAIRDHVAKPLGLSVTEAASGIHRIICETMAASARVHAVEKGKDIRRHALVAFGGAGPMNAREVARRLGCRRVLIPANAGVFSAIGLLVAPVMADAMRTHYTPLAMADWKAVKAIYAEMTHGLVDVLAEAGIKRSAMQFERSADMRYVGQGFEITTPVPASFARQPVPAVTEDFYAAYDELFGHHLTAVDVEVLTWRLKAFAAAPAPPRSARRSKTSVSPTPRTRRKVYFPDSGRFHAVAVYPDNAHPPGQRFTGPALIEQSGATIVIGPGDAFKVDRHGNVVITLAD